MCVYYALSVRTSLCKLTQKRKEAVGSHNLEHIFGRHTGGSRPVKKFPPMMGYLLNLSRH